MSIDTEYSTDVPDYGDVMSIKEYLECVESGIIINYDGYGHPIRNGKMMYKDIIPSNKGGDIPKDAELIIWFNR